MEHWQLQQAKAQLSEVLRRARIEGPQAITVHGKNDAVVLTWSYYETLIEKKPTFIELMRRSPWVGVEFDLERNRSLARKVKL